MGFPLPPNLTLTGCWRSQNLPRFSERWILYLKFQASPREFISLPLCFHSCCYQLNVFTHKCETGNQTLTQVVLPSGREKDGKRPHLRGREVATLVGSIRLWRLVERKGGPKEVGGKVLKIHFIVSGSTLSAQNCTKHIQRETNYTWMFKLKTKLMHVSLK